MQTKPQKLGFKRLYRNLDKILLLFFMVFMAMEFAWIPFTSWAAESLLKQTGYEFLSYNNAVSIFTANWLVTAQFLGLFLVNLLVAYFQTGIIFMGVRNLLDKEERSHWGFIKATLRDSWIMLLRARPGKVLFIVCYMGILFPFFRQILKIYYLNKILIPEFIQEYLSNQYYLGWVIGILAIMLFLMAVRFMFAIPKIFSERISVREAIRFSLDKTRKRLIFYSWHLSWIVFKSLFIYAFFVIGIVFLQKYADTQSNAISLGVGVFNFVVMKLAYYFMLSYFLIKFLSFLTDKSLADYPRKKGKPWLRALVLLASCLIFGSEGYVYMQFPLETIPLTISHRGVSNGNGVQNTIESLEKTALLKPDYIEMDVQETKDGQFVMMHDATLKDLAGVDKHPQELTLAELTALDISENGYRTKISSFDAYLKRANQLGQRLLIEIKTSKLDSSDMMERFLKKYAANIKIYGHQMQSLDYQVIDKILDYDKDIPAFFILPYNTIFPRTKASGYTMEYSTLDENFVNKLWSSDKLLYTWTINTEDAVAKSFRLGVDGIITDDVEYIQSSIKELRDNPKYSTLLENKAKRKPSLSNQSEGFVIKTAVYLQRHPFSFWLLRRFAPVHG